MDLNLFITLAARYHVLDPRTRYLLAGAIDPEKCSERILREALNFLEYFENCGAVSAAESQAFTAAGNLGYTIELILEERGMKL